MIDMLAKTNGSTQNLKADNVSVSNVGLIHSSKPSRFVALDALRGLAIILMLFVNNFGRSAETPVQLRHAGWGEGVHLADLAFPWFLFCVGVAIPFSAAGFYSKNEPQWKFDLRVMRRTLILLAIGAILDSMWDRRLELFSIGVLQTIALAYLVGSIIYELHGYRRLGIAFVGLIAYWFMIKYMPIPGGHVGAFSESENFIRHLNSNYLGQVGLWNATRIIPAASLVLISTFIGDVVIRKDTDLRKIFRLAIIGGILVAMGFVWSFSLPFNKWVWTPSYVLLSAGTGVFLLAIFHFISVGKKYSGVLFPFVVFGSNAILLYVLPILSKGLILSPLHIYIHGWIGVVPFVVFWWLVAWFLYQRRLFFRV